MMFVKPEKEDTSPSPKEPQSPKDRHGSKEPQSPKALAVSKEPQSPRGLQGSKEAQSSRDHQGSKEPQSHKALAVSGEQQSPRDRQGSKKPQSPRELQSPQDYHTPRADETGPSPGAFQTPEASDSPNTSYQSRDFFFDGNDTDDDQTTTAENSDLDDASDDISGEEYAADGDGTKLGGGDADADLVDSLLQEEDNGLDSPMFREYKYGDKEEKLICTEMKMRKKKALLEFRCKVEDAILGNYLLGVPSESDDDPIGAALEKEQLRHTTLWGIPLLPSKSHTGSDTVLLKFLKARDYKVEEAYEMLRKTMIWRKELDVEDIMEEKFPLEDLLQVGYTNSVDKKGHPLCYNLFGPFRNREMHKRLFGTEEKRKQYMRWRVHCMEAAIRQLSFKPGMVDSIVVITDLGNSPGPAMKELRNLCKHLICLFEDYYPEFVYRNLVINVPFWYYVSHAVHSKFAGQKAKKGFVFARPNKTAETLLKYINAENLPIQHGGLQRQDDQDFSGDDKTKQLVVKPNSVGTVEIPVSEGGTTVNWDVTVTGWEVSYKEEFVPLDEGSYKVLIQKEKKLGECARNFYHVREPGNIVFSIQNPTSKKKKVFYRTKCSLTYVACPFPPTKGCGKGDAACPFPPTKGCE